MVESKRSRTVTVLTPGHQRGVAVITGGSSGIGAATAKALAAHGYQVVLLARRRKALAGVVAAIAASGGEATAFAVDLSDPIATGKVAAAVLAELGTPRLVVNCAGAGRWLSTEETEPAEAVEMMAVPYFAAFYVTRAFLPAMLALRSGTLVYLCSPASRIVWPGSTAYTAARWALAGFAESLRADLRGTGLRVMTVFAGAVEDEYWQHNPGTRERLPRIGRLASPLTPEQVAVATVRGLVANRREVVVPWQLRAFFLAHRVSPGLVDWLVRSTGWRHPAARQASRMGSWHELVRR